VFCTLKLIRTEAVMVILTAMRLHLSDPTVQNYGLGVLRNIAFLRMSLLSRGWMAPLVARTKL
jgi:hypothetical protein